MGCIQNENPHIGEWWEKGGVMQVLQSRGHCILFWFVFPPLQVAPSFVCSVASLNQFPGR